ncbi:MAG: hypothetical protein MJ016_05030 [Victivallaceae bacterium]|nr:hypothetical protein [Victivallaceae bacterium]
MPEAPPASRRHLPAAGGYVLSGQREAAGIIMSAKREENAPKQSAIRTAIAIFLSFSLENGLHSRANRIILNATFFNIYH